MKETLETYQVTQYGEYACSCCKKPLIGRDCLAVAYESDEEGYYWRTLHKECYANVVEEYAKALVENQVSHMSLEQYIYENYPISPAVEDVE